MDTENISIKNSTKGKLPSLPFASMKDAVLGKKYELSVFCAGEKMARKINKETRGKDYATNILSFPLSKNTGEIIFQLDKVKKDAKDFDMTYEQFLKFLFIHGLLHLKGLDHGKKMESEEKKFLKRFSQ